ncbi:MAG: hypothetical protein IJD58_12895 [Lachnospiraceae bacterium]|nr:hypothetical protein [Lachnospiraceae bacterium]
MVYGIISEADNRNTLEVFHSKKINEDNIVHVNQLSNLGGILKSGDVVYVMSANRFLRVGQVLSFGRLCMSRGVTLRFITQPYLDITVSKHWKPAVINHMTKMMYIERSAMGRMSSACKYTNEYWEYLCRTFEMMNVELLAQTFANDGLMK